jgi:hypothetical protein
LRDIILTLLNFDGSCSSITSLDRSKPRGFAHVNP